MSLQSSLNSSDESCVFSGPITLKEVKKSLGIKVQRQTKKDVTTLPKKSPSHPKINEGAATLVDDVLKMDQDSTPAYSVEELRTSLGAVKIFTKQSTSGQDKINQLIGESKLNATNNTVESVLHVSPPASPVIIPRIGAQKELPAQISHVFRTPSSKTAKIPNLDPKTPLSVVYKRTPSKKCFQHVASPIAAYIRHSPQVPLVKDVYPKKPLPSSIPKLVQLKLPDSNKENINLPNVAYQSAKSIKINESKQSKLPQSKAKKATMTKPLVIKHQYRENKTKKIVKPNHEDSSANLILHQAEISVCTVKSAFEKPKKDL